MFRDFRKKISNLSGWSTKRRIIVFESDDWGSIRTRSKKDYEIMKSKGLDLDYNYFSRFDCLESNHDLENLFEVLNKYKDIVNRPVTFTPMCIVANPDFETILEFDFENYYFENLFQTIKKYPNSDKIIDLWNLGDKNSFFVPSLHGREHVNIVAWMNGLRENNKVLKESFYNGSIGVIKNNYDFAPEHLGALYPVSIDELNSFYQIIEDAGSLFSLLLNRKPIHFIAPNRESPKVLDKKLKEIGVKYLTVSKLRKYPIGDGSHKFEFNWLGKRNKNDQIIITRNCIFEPSSNLALDWVDLCLKDIKIAFDKNKPAVINTHRVNYIGSIDEKNASRGLFELDKLIRSIQRYWPKVEFMTSSDLGDIIKNS